MTQNVELARRIAEVGVTQAALEGAFDSGAGDVTVDSITDATAIGKDVLKSADAAAVRTLIGAGTGNSNLAIGTTATTAKAGNYQPTATNVTISAIDSITATQLQAALLEIVNRIKALEAV